MKRLVIFGVGQIGQVAHYCFTKNNRFTENGDYKISAFADDATYIATGCVLDLPVFSFEDIEKRQASDDRVVLAANCQSRWHRSHGLK